jgi:acetyltransferase-like isoleucine patch superfamily enzyme
MIHLISLVIQKIKKNPYTLDPSISTLDALIISCNYLKMLTRATAKRIFFHKLQGPIFIGSNVTFRHAKKISFGSGCIVRSDVSIDGLSQNGIIFGNNVTIPEHTFIRCTGVISNIGKGLTVGNNTGLGHSNFINAQGGVSIGDDVIIGPYVKILSENHSFSDSTRPIREQGVTRKGIDIHNNVWIGAGVTILDGVTIHTGAVLAAGAVVTKDVPAHSVAGGVPARIIGRTFVKDDQL